MQYPPSSSRTPLAKAVGYAACAAVLLLAVMALVGWVAGNDLLKGIDANLIPMRIVTAVCFILSALAMVTLLANTTPRRKALVTGVAGAIIGVAGLLTLAVYAIELRTGQECMVGHWPILRWFLDQDVSRMALITTILFTLFGGVLVLLGIGGRRSASAAHTLLLPTAMLTYLIMVGYVLGIRAFYTWAGLGVALNSGVAFVALCLAAFCVRPDSWLMAVFTSSSAGGAMARRLLPALLLLPLIIGFLRITGERMGLFGSEVGIALVVVAYTVCFLLLVWFNARSVNRTDDRRRDAEAQAAQQREWLQVTLGSIGDAVLATDTDARVSFLNEVAQQLTGWTMQQAKGRPVNEVFRIINEQTRQAGQDIVARVLNEGCIVALANHTALVTRTGQEIPIEDSAAPIHGADGKIRGVVLVFHDVTEKRRAQEALRKSEERVRLKLNSILSPEGDLSTLELGDLVDAPAIQSLMNDHYQIARIPMALIDSKGKVLVGVGWQDICTRFHRMHPETCQHCVESDLELTADLNAGEYRLYKCKNHMWDMATPIFVADRRIGLVFSGQFTFDDETPDREFFRQQARQYGFDEQEYLAALDRVPRLSRSSVEHGTAFLLKLAGMLSKLGHSNVTLAKMLSERKRTEDALLESRERLELALDSAEMAPWDVDLGNREVFSSARMLHLYGLDDSSAPHTRDDWRALVLDEDRPLIQEAIQEAAKSGKPYSVEYRIRRQPDSALRWLRSQGNVHVDAHGRPIRQVGMVIDITDQKNAQETLERSMRRFELLARTSNDLLQAAEPQKVVESLCHRVMEHIDCHAFFNFLADEQAGRLHLNACAGIGPEEAAKIEWLDYGIAICGCAAREGCRIVAEHIPTTPDPRTELVKSYGIKAYACHPLLGTKGEVIGTLSFGTRTRETFSEDDLSLMKAVADQVSVALIRMRGELALRQTADELGRSNKELEQFAYVASHDLQEPLRQVRSFTQLLGERHGDKLDGSAKQYMQYIVEGAGRMSVLVHDLLAYSRVGNRDARRRKVACHEALERALANLRTSITESNAQVTHDELPTVLAEPTQLTQLFQNLIGNAVKFRREGVNPEIHIGALSNGGHWIFQVKDNGIGIDPQYHKRVFQIFQRLHGREKYTGTGIGLAICKKIVEQHGGEIWIESKEGQGATFCFTLPKDSTT